MKAIASIAAMILAVRRTSPDSSAHAAEPWTLARLVPFVSRVHLLAFADQAVVSAASCLTTVIIGRHTDPSPLGIYAIAISVLASAYTVQV